MGGWEIWGFRGDLGFTGGFWGSGNVCALPPGFRDPGGTQNFFGALPPNFGVPPGC